VDELAQKDRLLERLVIDLPRAYVATTVAAS